MADLKRLQLAVEVGDRETAVEVTQQAIDEAIPPKTVLDAMTDAMGVVGQRFATNEIYVPEMLISARAMKAAVALLEPLLVGSGYVAESVAIMGTIKGDLHDIGKNLVGMMLQGAGFEVVNLGTGVTAAQFVAAVREHSPQIVGMSALLTTTLPHMSETLAALKAAGLRESVKVMVGGAPVTQAWADEVGADGYGANAGMAVERAKALVS